MASIKEDRAKRKLAEKKAYDKKVSLKLRTGSGDLRSPLFSATLEGKGSRSKKGASIIGEYDPRSKRIFISSIMPRRVDSNDMRSVDPTKIHDYIKPSGGRGWKSSPLDPHMIKEGLKKLKKAYPEAVEVLGTRQTGTHAGGGGAQSFKLPKETESAFSKARRALKRFRRR